MKNKFIVLGLTLALGACSSPKSGEGSTEDSLAMETDSMMMMEVDTSMMEMDTTMMDSTEMMMDSVAMDSSMTE